MSKKATDKQRKSKAHKHEAMNKSAPITVLVKGPPVKTIPVGPTGAEWDRIMSTIRSIRTDRVYGPFGPGPKASQ